MSHFFIDRPIFATVLSVVIVIVGCVALLGLPVAQYPEVTPPVVQVSATYPGANAKTVADVVATPIELEVNGVERMLYMSSRSTNDGQMYLDVTFEVGTDLDMAQVLVQNRVAIAEAKLPEEVKRLGVTAKKKSPAILMCVNITSPGNKRNQLYLSNFALTEIKDELTRVIGVGDVTFLGPRDYSLRIWLDPEKLAAKQLTAGDVIKAIQEQNVQVAAGRLGQPPVPAGSKLAFQLTINTQGRLVTEDQFGQIVVKTGEQGQNVFLRQLVRDAKYDKNGVAYDKGIELGAKNYDVNSYLDGAPAVTLAVFQLPGSNALKTAEAIQEKMHELKQRFPEGVDYGIYYDTTTFVHESIHEVVKTLIEAFILVFIVVLVFLQDWRATIVPMIAVPVSLVGTFALMAMLGFSLNNLSLFGLVLAIGIVVDDAIVVVENVERYLSMGYGAREAARRAMTEVSGAVIGIALVLTAVFVPTAFMAGISGEFFRQFALTIAASTIISAFNSLTLSPALCALLFKGNQDSEHPAGHAAPVGHGEGHGQAHAHKDPLPRWFIFAPINRVLEIFFSGFNRVFDAVTAGYGRLVAGVLRISAILLLVYMGLMGLAYLGFHVVPVGFIPDQDKGYLVVNVQLPDGATLERTDKIVEQLSKISRDAAKIPGVAHTIDVPGYSILLSTNISNVGGMFVILKPFEARKGDPEQSAPVVAAKLRKAFAEIRGRGSPCSGRRRSTAWGRPAASSSKCRTSAAPDSGPARRGAESGRSRQRRSAVGRLVQQFLRRPAAAFRRYRPRQAQVGESLARRREPHAASLSRRLIRERHHVVQSQLAGKRPGRSRLSPPRGRHRPAGGSQRRRAIDSAQHAHHRQKHQRPGGGQPLQQISLGGSHGEHGRRHEFRRCDRDHGRLDQGNAAANDEKRVDRNHSPADYRRERFAHQAGLPVGGRVRVSRARGPI